MRVKRILSAVVIATVLLTSISGTTITYAGPPTATVKDCTVNLTEGGTFTSGNLTLVVKSEGASYELTDGNVTVTGLSEASTKTTGPMINQTNVTILTISDCNDLTALAKIMPTYWDNTIVLNQDHTFNANVDITKAIVKYTAKSIANKKSKTGYTTTISVVDNSYKSMYAYGMWMCCVMDIKNQTYSTCDPQDWKNGMYYFDYSAKAMTLKDGVWTLSLDLASGIIPIQCYANLDPSYLKGVTVSDENAIMTPYDAVKQSKNFDWTLTKEKTKKIGKVTTKVLDAKDFNGAAIKIAVYTPYGYNPKDTSTRYPVLYLIPGMQTEYNTWFTGGKANIMFDNLIASGKMAPTIIVTTTRDVAKMDCWDIWDTADDRSKENGDGDGYINLDENGKVIHSKLVTDVIPYIDKNYNSAADAKHRAIVGTSMGGVATTQIWLTDSNKFNYYGFFSGADMWFKDLTTDKNAAAEYKALREKYTAQYEKFNKNAIAASSNKKFVVGGGIADRNAFGGDQNSAGANNVDAWMTTNGIKHEYSIPVGAHDWTTWTQLLGKFTNVLTEKGSTWNIVIKKQK